MKINSRQELYDYLNKFDFTSVKDTGVSSVYFLIKFSDDIWPIHFMHYAGSYFESPCALRSFPLRDDEMKEYVQYQYGVNYEDCVYAHESNMQRNGIHYEIENLQCSPFLPEQIEIIDVFSDKKCLDWLLTHANDKQEGCKSE